MPPKIIAQFSWFFTVILSLLFLIAFPAEAAPKNRLPLTANPAEFVKVAGNQFILGNAPWYPNGINYFPLNSLNIPATQAPSADHWFAPGVYNQSAIEKDLALIRSLGMNMVAIGLPIIEGNWGNFNDFLDRCQRHQLKIFLFLPMADPLGSSFDRLEEILSNPTLNLPNRSQIFAYDIAWEPNLGDENNRSRWNGVFSRWIASTYPNLEAASRALGFSIPLTGNGYQASFRQYEIPVMIPAGHTFSGNITVKNSGTIVWYRNQEFRLGLKNGGGSRFALPGDVRPGEEVTIPVSFQVPPSPGRYRYYFGMVQERVRWFGDLDIEVEVTSSGGSEVRKIVNMPTPVVGPSDYQLIQDGQWRQFVQAYRRAIDTEISRRYGEVVRWIKSYAPYQLVSARQGYGGNGSEGWTHHYPLDLASTAAHLDFLCPEGYEIGGLDSNYIRSGMAATTAYARWASGGKPVVWVEFGYDMYRRQYTPYDPYNPPNGELSKQRQYYSLFLNALLETGADGSGAWWYAGGIRQDEGSDYGIVDPDGRERPVCPLYRELAHSLNFPRPVKLNAPVYTFRLLSGVRGYTDIYQGARGPALEALNRGQRFVMQSQGAGTHSDSNPITYIGTSHWMGPTQDLWTEISDVELRAGAGGQWFKVMPGGVYGIPQGSPIYMKAKVKNLGPATWLAENRVNFAVNENISGFRFRWPIPRPVNRLETLEVSEAVLTPGLIQDTEVQFQLVAEGRTWIDGSLRIRLVTYAGSGGCQNMCQAGARQCSSDGAYQVCGDYDHNGCLEWGSSQSCPSGQTCRDGQCVAPPSLCRPGEVLINQKCEPMVKVRARKGTEMYDLPCPPGYQFAGSWLTGIGKNDGLVRGMGYEGEKVDSGVMWLCSADPGKVKTVIAWNDCDMPKSTLCESQILGAWHVGNSCTGQVSGNDSNRMSIKSGWLGLCVAPEIGAKAEVAHNDCPSCGSATGCGGWRGVGVWKPDPASCGCENGRPQAPIGLGASGGLISSGWMGICVDAR